MLFGKGSFGTMTFNGQSLKEKKNSSISLEIKKKNKFFCFAYLNNASRRLFYMAMNVLNSSFFFKYEEHYY